MDDKEAIEMMQRCVSDLRMQRATIDHLQPQAEAYEVIRDIVRLMPGRSMGMGEDLVWVLEKRIRELQPKPKVD